MSQQMVANSNNKPLTIEKDDYKFFEQEIMNLKDKSVNEQIDFLDLFIEGYGVNCVIDDKENTMLHLVCEKGMLEMVKYLVKMGAELDLRNKDHNNALFCSLESLEIIKFILTSKPELINVKCGIENRTFFNHVPYAYLPFNYNIYDLVLFLVQIPEFDFSICDCPEPIIYQYVMMYNMSFNHKNTSGDLILYIRICEIVLTRMKEQGLNMYFLSHSKQYIIHAICFVGIFRVLKFYLELVPDADVNVIYNNMTPIQSYIKNCENWNNHIYDKDEFIKLLYKHGAKKNKIYNIKNFELRQVFIKYNLYGGEDNDFNHDIKKKNWIKKIKNNNVQQKEPEPIELPDDSDQKCSDTKNNMGETLDYNDLKNKIEQMLLENNKVIINQIKNECIRFKFHKRQYLHDNEKYNLCVDLMKDISILMSKNLANMMQSFYNQ